MNSTRALLGLGLFAFFALQNLVAADQSGLVWQAGQSSIGLFKNGKAVWEFHYGTNQATKPFFHPVALPGGSSLSWQSPPDHPWHYGLWFSWKYLNGLNYWEENTNRQCEGAMTWQISKTQTNADFSAQIELVMDYRPHGAAEPLLTEKRVITITRPADNGSYSMDWSLEFKAGKEKVKFDRTPLPGEPGGQTWGGYAGLSLRLAKDLSEGQITATADIGKMEENRYRFGASAADFHGKIDGADAGVAFLDNPGNPRFPTRWYAITEARQPFWYLNAAFLQSRPFELEPGETLLLRYRVAVHPGVWSAQRLKEEQTKYAQSTTVASDPTAARLILVYTKNGKGYVHDNIPASVKALGELGAANGFAVDATDDSAVFTDQNLKKYKALVFDNTNNDIFDNDQQKAALQNYIHAGGGFAAIHSACGSERQWPWFWSLLGGKFVRHPVLQPFTINVRDHAHPSTAHLGQTWQWADEFYYVDHLNPDLHVLLSGDRTKLNDSQKDNFGEQVQGESPLAWCHEFEGGRAWFTALGHRSQDYSDPRFRQHLLGGILWAMGQSK